MVGLTVAERSIEQMLQREQVANKPKHWVRVVTACNSKCLFCLDSDTPRGVYLPEAEVHAELERGRDELGAEKVILSGGEGSLHPKFVDFIAYAKQLGYDRVQTVTNGYMFADKPFYERCVRAGLGEITYSLHGHTEQLHDHLTQTPGAFRRLVKAMLRSQRDPRVITNVDVVINKQNVAVIDKILELCIKGGVTEFDLLHVIPQAAAFDNRDELFYDVREHLPVLHKVFRLNRHPRIVVWTNRFPVSYLEGLEDLIQDPHKMLDEVNGRRFHVRRYLDLGTPLECRHAERCPHCFIEPFCTTMDRVVADQNAAAWDIWWFGDEPWTGEQLPYGCNAVGVSLQTLDALPTELPAGVGLYIEVADVAGALPDDRPVTLVVERADQLDAWFGRVAGNVYLEVRLNRDTAAWLLANVELVAANVDRFELHQPSHEKMQTAATNDVRDPRDLFSQLGLRVKVSGLPACLAPNAELVDEPKLLPRSLFDFESGRLKIRDLARYHVSRRYRAKSVRCQDCPVTARCEGAHINMIRDQGLAILTPLEGDQAADASAQLEARFPQPPPRLANASEPVAPAQSLPGFAQPTSAPEDPLAVIQQERLLKKLKRRRGEA